jgi:hypothetical protein
MYRTFVLLVLSLLILTGSAAFGGEQGAATLADLAWMTGDWQGKTPNGTIEEHWLVPQSGSMAALVRMTNGEATAMIELIVIEEEEGSLMLRLQQWNPGFMPRSEKPQTLKLVSSEPNKVKFEAQSEGGLKTLGYSRDGEQFSIHVGAAQGEFKIDLQAIR